MVTFIRIKSPPRTLPTPPWRRRRRRTLCPLLISLSSFFFIIQLLQGRQCLFKVRSALYWHSIGTCLVRTKPPITLVIVIFLWVKWWVWSSSARTSICRQTSSSRPFSIIRLRNVSSRMNLSWLLGRTSSCTSSSAGWPNNIPCVPASYHIDVRMVVLSWWRTRELKEGLSCTGWISDSHLFLYARSAACAIDDANVPVW